MMTRLMLDIVLGLKCVLDCSNMCSSDAVLRKQAVILRCFMWWTMGYEHDDNDDAGCVARAGSRS